MRRATIMAGVAAMSGMMLMGGRAPMARAGPIGPVWIAQVGTPSFDEARSVAVDGSGNAYVTGLTYGSLGGPNQGDYDAFLVKFSPTGGHVWKTQLGTPDTDYAWAVAVDGSGNAYVTGFTYGSLGGPNQGEYDAFLVKYSSSGNELWRTQLGTSAEDYAFGLAVDGWGNAYITGYTCGSLGGTNQGDWDAFLAKYSPTGSQIWTSQLGSSGYDSAYNVAVDGLGNAYIAGWTNGNLGGSNQGGYDAFLAKYSPTGNLVWATQFGTADGDEALGVAVDGAGNAYVTGFTAADLGGPNEGDGDIFLAKYSETGSQIWMTQLGTSTYDYAWGVAVDGAGNAYVTGWTNGDLGGPNQGHGDVFLAKYSPTGSLIWITQLGTSSAEYAWGLTVDGRGAAYITGETWGSLGGAIQGDNDVFLAVYHVPEPATLGLLALGGCLWAARPRRRDGRTR